MHVSKLLNELKEVKELLEKEREEHAKQIEELKKQLEEKTKEAADIDAKVYKPKALNMHVYLQTLTTKQQLKQITAVFNRAKAAIAKERKDNAALKEQLKAISEEKDKAIQEKEMVT